MQHGLDSIGAIVQEARGRVLAALAAQFGDLELAEDVLQDACEQALRRWDRLPANPAGWLYTTARRKALDVLRRQQRFDARREQIGFDLGVEQDADMDDDTDHVVPDERLRLIFTCCHPAIEQAASVALTLKTLGRMSTAEIAHAFLVPTATMAQRLVRAKRKIRAAAIPFRVPEGDQMHERLGSVLSVLYLIFNAGYAAYSGAHPVRHELCEEAIRLGRILAGLLPAQGEVHGLLALMLLHDSRRRARLGSDGEFVTLEQQDRRCWDRHLIAEGLAALGRARAVAPTPGTYQLQAEISAEHARASSFESTRWTRIARAYDALHELTPGPVIRINAAVAMSYAHGAEVGLRVLAPLADDPAIQKYQPYHAALADLYRRQGDCTRAMHAYDQAIALSENEIERRFLSQRRAEVDRE